MAIFNAGAAFGNVAVDFVDVGTGISTLGYYADEELTAELTHEKMLDVMASAYAVGARMMIYRKIGYPDFASSSDSDISAAVSMARAGLIDLRDIWSVGDTRTVSLSAMAATGVGESHVAQDVDIVLMHKDWVDADGVTHPFMWGLKDGLLESGYLNSSGYNYGGWNSCNRRTWCNEVFFSALPSWLQEATGSTAVKTANGGESTTVISSDKCFLLAEREVFGGNSGANSTAESGLAHIEHYKTSGNRIKKSGQTGNAGYWWLRSPYKDTNNRFCYVSASGSSGVYASNYTGLIAPHGCIL